MNLLDTIFILLLSIVPTLIILGLILYSDRKSREPLLLILFCFFSGFITTFFSLNIQKILMNSIEVLNFSIHKCIQLFLLSAIEEYCKLFILYTFISKNKNFDDIYDGFVYSAIIALSFAGLETIMYVFKEITFKNMTYLTITRLFTSIPLHIVCGIIMGYYIALQKFSKNKKYKKLELFKSISIPIFIHACYNITLTYVSTYIKNQTLTKIILISFVIIIYSFGYIYIYKNLELNEKFIKNKKYPEKYKFLMHKRDLNKKNKTSD